MKSIFHALLCHSYSFRIQESYFTYSAQEESPINHDVHFRAGVGADGSDTYTPRTVIYDFKRNFGTMRRINELYDAVEDPREASLWYFATQYILITRNIR